MEGEGGLESALLDQRMRAEKHKTNFEALKTNHLMLQNVSGLAPLKAHPPTPLKAYSISSPPTPLGSQSTA